MTTTPALTRDIGQAEHTMRALLERLLDEAGLSFPEWTVLIFLDGAGSLSLSELVQRQVDGRVVPEAAARATVDGLLSRGLLAPADEAHGAGGPGGDGEDPRLAPTAAGEAVYRPARRTVARITDELYGDLPPADLEATHRTLAEVTSRAFARLAAAG
ncbi:MAG TPA: hypothetical protein VKA58_03635 [Propionibacteriaceae bacterium]|nr:hypothetical protein [Propionibacteriaceae bacterium]